MKLIIIAIMAFLLTSCDSVPKVVVKSTEIVQSPYEIKQRKFIYPNPAAADIIELPSLHILVPHSCRGKIKLEQIKDEEFTIVKTMYNDYTIVYTIKDKEDRLAEFFLKYCF